MKRLEDRENELENMRAKSFEGQDALRRIAL